MSTSAVTVSFYCHTCSAKFLLPAPPSPFHFTLCPRCRQDYLDDSPAPPHQAPQPVLPPPPPRCVIPWPSRSISSSTQLPLPLPPPPIPSSSSLASSTRLSSRSPTTAETTSMSQDMLPPLLSPWLLQASPPLASLPLHQHHRAELQPESSPLALCPSTTAETTPTFQVLLPPPSPPLPWDSQLHGPWDDEYIFTPSDSDYDSPPRPPPPPVSGGYQSPPRPPPPHLRRHVRDAAPTTSGPRAAPHPMFAYDATFDTPPPVFAYDATFDTPPPVFAFDATFDAPLQRGGSQAAPAESIAALPTVTVTDTALVCPICTDPLLASAPARRLPCSHLYHSDCIVTWLSLRNSCPVCRGSIPMLATDSASSPSPPSLHPTPPGRRRSLPGTHRIRRICSRLLSRMDISRNDRQTDSSRDVHV